jgi:hypothetical protein
VRFRRQLKREVPRPWKAGYKSVKRHRQTTLWQDPCQRVSLWSGQGRAIRQASLTSVPCSLFLKTLPVWEQGTGNSGVDDVVTWFAQLAALAFCVSSCVCGPFLASVSLQLFVPLPRFLASCKCTKTHLPDHHRGFRERGGPWRVATIGNRGGI